MNNLTNTVKNEIYRQFGNTGDFAKQIGSDETEINKILDNGIENSETQTVIKILNELKIDSEIFINVSSDEMTEKIIEISSLKK